MKKSTFENAAFFTLFELQGWDLGEILGIVIKMHKKLEAENLKLKQKIKELKKCKKK